MRFTTVALFAGAAIAMPGMQPAPEETVYSTKEVTITSCGPDVPDCPGSQTAAPPAPTGTGVSPGQSEGGETQYTTKLITITDCPPEVPNCPGRVETSTISICPSETAPGQTGGPEPTGVPTGGNPVPTDAQPTGPSGSVPVPSGGPQPPVSSEQPPYPTSAAPQPPVEPEPSTSVVTYTTCIPTVTSSTITLVPTGGPTGGPGGPQPSGGPIPSGGPAPSGTGVVPPSGTGVLPSGSATPPPFEGAASAFSGSFAAAGIAAMVAVFFA